MSKRLKEALDYLIWSLAYQDKDFVDVVYTASRKFKVNQKTLESLYDDWCCRRIERKAGLNHGL